MNLRFADNAVRVRLSAADVAQLSLGQHANCALRLPPGIDWQCEVRLTPDATPQVTCTALTERVQLQVLLPAAELARWHTIAGRARSIRTTIHTNHATTHASDVPLTLIIEQDLHPKTERS